MNRRNTARLVGVGLLVVAASAFGLHEASAEPDHRLESALRALRAAREDLHEVHGDYGGRREQALDFTTRALRQVEEAIEFDNRHDRRRDRR